MFCEYSLKKSQIGPFAIAHHYLFLPVYRGVKFNRAMVNKTTDGQQRQTNTQPDSYKC